NIPGKIFVDELGVNAQSSLFYNPKKLSNYTLDESEYNEWKSKFILDKTSKNMNIPQKAKGEYFGLRHVADYLFQILFGFPTFSNSSVRKKIRSILGRKVEIKKQYNHNIVSRINDFIFFPMQVSSDTQIKINSSIDNRQAIELIVNKYEVDNVIIKPHPADSDVEYVLDLVENSANLNVSNENTYSLIMRSKHVITINSTVGLEALIFGKPVTFLGNSIFSSMTKHDIAVYLMKYLINIDFFNVRETLSIDKIEEIYDRVTV
uniref:capsular polysaccharide export protein, LipB/KpsS family n=1 Tax=Vibrio cholerae TaxID=666 RepID=UPI001168A7BA